MIAKSEVWIVSEMIASDEAEGIPVCWSNNAVIGKSGIGFDNEGLDIEVEMYGEMLLSIRSDLTSGEGVEFRLGRFGFGFGFGPAMIMKLYENDESCTEYSVHGYISSRMLMARSW